MANGGEIPPRRERDETVRVNLSDGSWLASPGFVDSVGGPEAMDRLKQAERLARNVAKLPQPPGKPWQPPAEPDATAGERLQAALDACDCHDRPHFHSPEGWVRFPAEPEAGDFLDGLLADQRKTWEERHGEPDAGGVEGCPEPYAALLVILARVRCQALHGQTNGGRCVNCISWAKRIGGPEHLPRLEVGLDAMRRKAWDEGHSECECSEWRLTYRHVNPYREPQ